MLDLRDYFFAICMFSREKKITEAKLDLSLETIVEMLQFSPKIILLCQNLREAHSVGRWEIKQSPRKIKQIELNNQQLVPIEPSCLAIISTNAYIFFFDFFRILIEQDFSWKFWF